MLRPRLPRRPKTDLCRFCESLSHERIATPAARRPFHATITTATSQKRPSKLLESTRLISRQARHASTSRTASDGNRPRFQAANKGNIHSQQRQDVPDVDNLLRLANASTNAFLSLSRLPKEQEVLTALESCAAAARVIMDAKIQPLLRNVEHQSATAAANLLELDRNGQQVAKGASALEGPKLSVTPIRNAIKTLSNNAYTIISHPNVFISPDLLKKYVAIQARLGTPETLPHVLRLYATKPLPRESAGSITYAKQNPDKLSNAVDPKVAEMALDAAIEAKNLDVAVGVVEHSYASKASIRAKIFKKGFAPAGAVALFPVVAYSIATQVSSLQDTMDQSSGTFIAFAGVTAYVGFTAAIGLVAATTANDQMVRVSWAKGTPLRQRWIREDERAALDKIACSFGFSESHKYGEEEGVQFQALREYILTKGMVLDAVELMEDMSG